MTENEIKQFCIERLLKPTPAIIFFKENEINKYNETVKNCFVYGLFCPKIKMFRYIGISENPKIRFKDGHLQISRRENKHKERWISLLKKEKLIPTLHVFIENITINQAGNIEYDLINIFREKHPNILTNIADGGGKPPKQIGNKNFSTTDRGRQLSSERNSGINHPNYGNFGGESFNSKAIDKYDLCGNFIKTYNSIIEAEQELDRVEKTHIGRCCRRLLKKSEGFIWRWKGEPLGDIDIRSKKLRYVNQILKDGSKVKHNSILDASKKLNIDASSICGACMKKRPSAGGFKWEYCDEQ